MRNRLLCRYWILAASIIFLCTSGLYGSARNPEALKGPRADLIMIDSMRQFGALEKPPVEFLHDAHTRALADRHKDCTACHLTQDKRTSIKFKRMEDTDRTSVMNVYHKECISCHGEMRAAGTEAGPVECNECHAEKRRFTPSREPMGFDKSLHYRHSSAQEQKCDRCHHVYDEKAKKLFYAKGEEETCRYCHKAETRDKLISMRAASHISCIDCHRKNLAQNRNTGPVECAGCHDAAAQQKIEKLTSVPRMEAKQPDVVLIKRSPLNNPTENDILTRMNFVPFDHKAHEGYTDTCRGCHHETLKACNTCHTVAGTKEGNGVNLEEAMHQIDSSRSCRGCHLSRQNEKNCAGCHVFIGAGKEKQDGACAPCHMKPVAEAPAGPEGEKAMAAEMLQAGKPFSVTFNQEEIPEKVVINKLSDQYEAVDFPHRRIVNALVADIQDSKLAAYFHTDRDTVCQGCHHNSPASSKPPACANCHGKPLDSTNLLKPGIMGAYHLQCMGCHKAMGMAKPAACADCHKEKSK